MKTALLQNGKLDDFTLVTGFTYGYRHREDRTNMAPGVLTVGSQNVLTNTSGRVGVTKGFSLDGAASTVLAPILASFDWQMHTGEERHLRAGFLTSAGNDGKLQYRYVDTDGTVEWRDLMTGLTSVSFNFTDWWNSTLFQNNLLFVNGSSNIYRWTGGITTVASVTASVTGVISSIVLNAAGTGYHVNDIITIGGAGTGATFKVLTLSGSAIATMQQLTGGSGYVVTTGVATTVSPAGGTGATVDVLSIVTGGTITKEGSQTWSEVGFENTSSTLVQSITIHGVSYSYYGGANTNTLFGVSPDPSLASPAIIAGDIAHQTVVTVPNSTTTGLPATLANSLIGNLKNQIYIGSLVNNQVYVSKINTFTDYSFTTPVRKVGEGAILTLDSTPVAFVPQEDAMYISAGKDQWYSTQFQLSSDLASETLTIQRLKTTTQQGAQSQALTSKIRNNVVFVSFEPILNSLGRVSDVVLTPQVSDLSFPIVDDMNSYDFTDGDVFYYRNYIYVAIPQESVVRVYNMTNAQDSANSDVSDPNFYWEAPLTLPISRFSIIDGDLYGHSYQTSESYKLFDGYNFNGAPIDARAVFSYQNYGTRSHKKGFNEFYSEGYISPSTTLTLTNTYEIDGCSNNRMYDLSGTNNQFVCIIGNNSSLGKSSLGKNPLGSSLEQTSANELPPKFRWIRTFPDQYFYEHQIAYSSLGVDQQWEILSFGPQLLPVVDTNINIKE